MKNLFAQRIDGVQPSVIRTLLSCISDSDVISLAGGHPSPDLFPVQEIGEICSKVLKDHGGSALQYSTSEGYLPLREMIAARYREQGIPAESGNILITSGSQQALDLLARLFIDKGDRIAVESPSYLGALQALSVYQPKYVPVPLNDEGIDLRVLEQKLGKRQKGDAEAPLKMVYTIPNFQNPTGISYSPETRKKAAELIGKTGAVLIVDDPYSQLRFKGEQPPVFGHDFDRDTVLLGTFSKVFCPSFRLGWVYAPDWIMEKLIILKQAVDLHTNYFGQLVVHRFLQDYDLDAHIDRLQSFYGSRQSVLREALCEHLPEGTWITKPEGGMFLWARLPFECDGQKLYETAKRNKVVYVPGMPFFTDGSGGSSLRLNYTFGNEAQLREGAARIGQAVKQYLAENKEPDSTLTGQLRQR